MLTKIYWTVEVWELLLIALLMLIGLIWLIWVAIKKPRIKIALSELDKSLDTHPLLFFNYVKGIVCLNTPAEALVHKNRGWAKSNLSKLVQAFDVALQQEDPFVVTDLPLPGYSTLIVPISAESPHQSTGVLGIIIERHLELKLIQLNPVITIRDDDTESEWVMIGHAFRSHIIKPLAQVQTEQNEWHLNHLTANEHNLLNHFTANLNEPQKAEILFAAVWNDSVEQYGLTQNQHERLRQLIRELRKKIEPIPHKPRYLITVRGVGYTLFSDKEIHE